jgi:hypothetical protein
MEKVKSIYYQKPEYICQEAEKDINLIDNQLFIHKKKKYIDNFLQQQVSFAGSHSLSLCRQIRKAFFKS